MAQAWICDICEVKSDEGPHRYQILIADQRQTEDEWPEVCSSCMNAIKNKINSLASKKSSCSVLDKSASTIVHGRFMQKREGDPGTFSHCGSTAVHGPHQHDTVMNEGPYVGLQCRGTPPLDPLPDPGFWTWESGA